MNLLILIHIICNNNVRLEYNWTLSPSVTKVLYNATVLSHLNIVAYFTQKNHWNFRAETKLRIEFRIHRFRVLPLPTETRIPWIKCSIIHCFPFFKWLSLLKIVSYTFYPSYQICIFAVKLSNKLISQSVFTYFEEGLT